MSLHSVTRAIVVVWSSAGWQHQGRSCFWTCWSGNGEPCSASQRGGGQTVCGWGESCLWRCPPQTSSVLDSLSGGEWGTSDALGSFHHPLEWFTVSSGATAIPHRDAGGEDALDGAAAEVHQNLRGQMGSLLRKKRRWWAFLFRVEVLRVQERSSEMWTPRNLKLVFLDKVGKCVIVIFWHKYD